MQIKTLKAPDLPRTHLPRTPPNKTAVYTIFPDGRTEIKYEDSEPKGTVRDVIKHPSAVAGTTLLVAANFAASSSQAQIAQILGTNLHVVQPQNGWNGLAGNIKEVASNPVVQNIVVGLSAGFWMFAILDHFKLSSRGMRIGIAVVVAMLVIGAIFYLRGGDPIKGTPPSAPQDPLARYAQ